MNAHERAEMVIRTVKLWQLVQLLDARLEDNDAAAHEIAAEFFRRYDLSVESARAAAVVPFAQLKTTLALLLVTLCFARARVDGEAWNDAGMTVKPEYDLACAGPTDPNIEQVMRTIRNAAAHAFEDDECVTFPEGAVVRFQSGRALVAFMTAEGFVAFLRDYTRAVQKIVVAQLGADDGALPQ